MHLYDFSKNIGDTIQVQLGICNNIYKQIASITSIDTILINDKYRKVFYLNSLSGESIWIEGIGSTNGLFYPVIPPLSCICSWNLVCYHQNNAVVFVNHNNALSYLTPNSTCFPSTIDGLNSPTRSSTISISPNPVTGSSLIKWEISESNRYATFMITDVLGKKIKTINVFGKTEININRSDFAKGLYVGKLVLGTGYEATVKIIVQ